MAAYTIAAGNRAKHVTLVANDVTTFTFGGDSSLLEILSDGTSDIYYTLDGTTPAIKGDNSLRIPTGVTSASSRGRLGRYGSTSSIIMVSTGTPVVSVHLLS